MGLVAAGIAPHGSLAVEELCGPGELELAAATRAAMRELGRRFAAAAPETLVVLTPHGLHVEGHLAVVVAGRTAGGLEGADGRIALELVSDLPLARALLDGLAEADVPALGVSYGGNDPDEAEMPLDWGALIPLWFLGGRLVPPPRVLLVAPARELPPAVLVRAGAALASAATRTGRRVGLIASADQAHTHDPSGPYGFDPAAAELDRRVRELVEADDLAGLRSLPDELIAAAKPDSWWQLLMLYGALEGDAARWRGELLSYEAPTYYGMLVAGYAPGRR